MDTCLCLVYVYGMLTYEQRSLTPHAEFTFWVLRSLGRL